MHYISSQDFIKLLESLRADYEVYTPIKKANQIFYKKYTGLTAGMTIGGVRPFEPLKAFYLPARGRVSDGFKTEIPHSQDKPFAIVGVKACDLKGFKVQDHVFKDHDYEDPFYIRNRDGNLIISADCTCAIETCFCLALGMKPYPREDFDLNLSELEGGFVAEAGSTKGQVLVKKYSSLFKACGAEVVNERDLRRARVIKEVEKNIQDNNIPYQEFFSGVVEKNYESDIWADEAKTCVECGACNTVCPTCHCFLLYDQNSQNNMARLRIWDSCMIKDFARVAGGANPRPKLWMRLRNRFEKKFDFFPKVAGVYACTGCGRCISGCPAKIDIRKVLKRLVSNADNRKSIQAN